MKKMCSATENLCTNEHPNPEASSLRKISNYLTVPLEMLILDQCLKGLNKCCSIKLLTLFFPDLLHEFYFKTVQQGDSVCVQLLCHLPFPEQCQCQRPSGIPAVLPSGMHLPLLKECNSRGGLDLISGQDRGREIKKMEKKTFQKVIKCDAKVHTF